MSVGHRAHAHQADSVFAHAALAAILVGVAGATFDIVIDAYRIEVLEPRQLGVGSGMSQYGWRIGSAGAGALALVVAARADWSTAYLACAALERDLRQGLTEHDVLSIVYGAYIKNGGDPGIHFIASTHMDEPDRFVPWQKQTARVLEAGSVVITELTVSYWGYSTQIHRPFAIAREPSPIYRRLFDTAQQCFEDIRKICQPGISSEEIVAASSIIEENGFTSYDSVFHGEAGKSPELGTKSAAHPLEPWTLQENMVHVIQPNPVTRDFRAGLQLGAAVVVKPSGGELLHNYPFKFPVCG